MKILLALNLTILCVFLLGASSCEEKVADANGIHTIPDPQNPGHYIVVEDAGGGKVGKVLTTAQGATSGIPIAGQVMWGAVSLAQLLHQILLSRAKSAADAKNADYDKTHSAANSGLQSFVDSQPAAVGHALLAELDHALDSADANPAHQDALLPQPKVA